VRQAPLRQRQGWRHLLCVGIIRRGKVRVSEYWETDIREATKAIQHRILDIEHQFLNKKCG
jgi:hypothetical protein